MLFEFLLKNQEEILALTERKSLELAGLRPSSVQLKQGLPIFYNQLMKVLRLGSTSTLNDIEVAASAGLHGTELLRLGYTLSHVVHAYGAMCQSITEVAITNDLPITSSEFRDLNRCLDVAIAGAVTEYQALRNTQEITREVKHLGFLAHELRNVLAGISLSIQLIKKGTVGFEGSTGQALERGLKRMEELVDRSLTEVRLRVDPEMHAECGYLLQLVDQIVVTAAVEAQSRNQTLVIQMDPTLVIDVDQQLFNSALSNLIQNALKYTRAGGVIQVRGNLVGEHIVVEVEDECGGHLSNAADLFKPYVQQHENRKGLGLGLTIAQRAIALNHGTIEVRNLAGKGCIFTITLPKKTQQRKLAAEI